MEIQDGKHQMSFVFFTTQAYYEIVKLHIVYTRESERARLRYTFERRDFYLSKNHPVNLPDTITLSNLKLEDALLAADKEFPSNDAIAAKKQIQACWHEHVYSIMHYFESLTFELPESIQLTLTQYGGGGSYNVNTSEIIVNINYNTDPLSILIHEITHIIVDAGLVHKFGLNHEEKEGLVKWLITNDTKLSEFIIVPKRSPIDRPKQTVLDELDRRGYAR
ncbi:MAG: hypothetical protein AAB395_04295 [Patescibacteria group bacterium]